MEENKELKEYNIYAGLGGGFGGADYHSTILAKDHAEAEDYAYAIACEDYESYEGSYSIKDWGDIAEELELDSSTEDPEEIESIQQAYEEERNNWIDYYAVLTEDDDIPEDELVREHDLLKDSSKEN